MGPHLNLNLDVTGWCWRRSYCPYC